LYLAHWKNYLEILIVCAGLEHGGSTTVLVGGQDHQWLLSVQGCCLFLQIQILRPLSDCLAIYVASLLLKWTVVMVWLLVGRARHDPLLEHWLWLGDHNFLAGLVRRSFGVHQYFFLLAHFLELPLQEVISELLNFIELLQILFHTLYINLVAESVEVLFSHGFSRIASRWQSFLFSNLFQLILEQHLVDICQAHLAFKVDVIWIFIFLFVFLWVFLLLALFYVVR